MRRRLRAGRQGRCADRRGAVERCGRARGPQHEGHLRDARRGATLPHRPGRRGLQHHRCGGCVEARDLRLQLSGEERDRCCRADLRADSGARPAHSRQRRGAARGEMEQEGLCQGARPARADARRAGHRQHRAGSHQARRGVRPRRHPLEPALRRGNAADERRGSADARTRSRGATDEDRARGDARRRRRARRHPQRPPRVRT